MVGGAECYVVGGSWSFSIQCSMRLLDFIYTKTLGAAGLILAVCFFVPTNSFAQVKWTNVDSLYGRLHPSLQVYKTTDSLDGRPFIAFYAKAKLKDRDLDFTADTSKDRRLTPFQFYEKNDHPLLVVNCTFFSYETNRPQNVVVKNGKMLAFNRHTIPMRGKDTFQYKHPFTSAIGIDKKRNADVAWLFADSTESYPYATQFPMKVIKDSMTVFPYYRTKRIESTVNDPFDGIVTSTEGHAHFEKWKMITAVGGEPVLVQDAKIKITNNEELRFAGKAINDKHPRTCMGYTKGGYLIIMVIQGRYPGIAEGATLEQEAKLMIELGCTEALNLDGGGSSCMLINGKETIRPSEKGMERPVPAVFLVR